jgi:hypothetical protein
MEQEGNAPLSVSQLQTTPELSESMLLVTYSSSAKCAAAMALLAQEGIDSHATSGNMVRILRCRIP